MTFDLTRVRADLPALRPDEHGRATAHFDGPGGSQVPRQVAHAVAMTLGGGLANRGTLTAAEQRATDVVVESRRAVADLLGADPRGVVFGRSTTQLAMDLARTLSEDPARPWGPGDEVVVTRLDHDAHVRPWVLAAERTGATVRWVGFDRTTAELDDVAPLLSERTRLVAVTGASNVLGTRPDVRAVADAAHAVGALCTVDAVHLVPHAPVDLAELGADVLFCSPYKFFGPHLGAMVADPSLLETWHPAKLLPSTDEVPERFELGTLPYELLAGTTAAVDWIAGLAPGGATDRRARVLASMAAVEAHEDALLRQMLDGLGALPGVTVHGAPARRTPTVFFSVDGRTPPEVHAHLASRRVNAPGSSFYAIEACRWLGLGDAGAVRAGAAAYTSPDDVERLVTGVAELCR